MSGRPDLHEDLRKGWCPGALRPMMAREGLLVRLRLTGGIVPAAVAHAIADMAERHGNGLLDLSARANLQLRGVREGSLPAVLAILESLGLLDADAAGEARRNVLASPLAGLHRHAPDIRPIVASLERALAADTGLRALPSKFGFLVDDGGSPDLASVTADVRFDWIATERAFAVGLGGTAGGALKLGLVAPDDLPARASALAYRLLEKPGEPHRITALIREIGRDATAAWFGTFVPTGAAPPAGVPRVVGAQNYDGVPALGLAAPFGRLDAGMLRAAAHLAEAGAGELRLTPWRTILVPHAAHPRNVSAVAGFIVDPADPRLRVAACTGQAGCERGTTDTHTDAAALAGLVSGQPDKGVILHVSGCAKGCAHPRRTAVTLVGRNGRYDLVRNGRPSDRPLQTGLELAAVGAAFHRAAVAP